MDRHLIEEKLETLRKCVARIDEEGRGFQKHCRAQLPSHRLGDCP
jgi:hypothetical protein